MRLLRESGKSARQLGRELGVSQSVLSRWKRQADEAEEVRRLRREVAQLRLDRDILKKATAFFAKESS